MCHGLIIISGSPTVILDIVGINLNLSKIYCWKQEEWCANIFKIPKIQFFSRQLGFPDGYTYVNGLSLERREQLLSIAWSVPVIKFLLFPLTSYYLWISSFNLAKLLYVFKLQLNSKNDQHHQKAITYV